MLFGLNLLPACFGRDLWTGIIFCKRPANEKTTLQCNVVSHWLAHSQNDPCWHTALDIDHSDVDHFKQCYWSKLFVLLWGDNCSHKQTHCPYWQSLLSSSYFQSQIKFYYILCIILASITWRPTRYYVQSLSTVANGQGPFCQSLSGNRSYMPQTYTDRITPSRIFHVSPVFPVPLFRKEPSTVK